MQLTIVSAAPYLRRSLQKDGQDIPPFMELKIIRKDDPSYEDAVFNFRWGGLKSESPILPVIDESNSPRSLTSPLRNMPIDSGEFDNSVSTMHAIKSLVASILSHDEDGYYDREDKIEVWMVYDPSEDLGVKSKLIAATCKLPQSPTAKIYANTDYRGNIFIPGKSISPPLYFWEEVGLGRDAAILVQGDCPAMIVNLPEEMEYFVHFEVPWKKKDVEEAVMVQYLQNCEHETGTIVPREDLIHEPKGGTEFPDYEIRGSSIYFEITTLRDGLNDRQTNIDKGWRSLDQIESLYRKDNAREALHRAINKKAKRAREVPAGYDYVLLIASELFPLHHWYSIWDGLDLSPFSKVVIANRRAGSKGYELEFELVPKSIKANLTEPSSDSR